MAELVPLLEESRPQVESQWLNQVIDQGLVFSAIAFTGIDSEQAYNEETKALMPLVTVVAFLCFVIAKFKLGYIAEMFLTTFGFFAINALVCMSLMPREFISKPLELIIIGVTSVVFVLPLIWVTSTQAVHSRRNSWADDDNWKQAWTCMAVTLFTVIGGEKVTSETCVALLTVCRGLGYMLLLEMLFLDSTHLVSKCVVLVGRFLQVPMALATMFGYRFPGDNITFPILIVSFVIGAWMVVVKCEWLTLEKARNWVGVAVEFTRYCFGVAVKFTRYCFGVAVEFTRNWIDLQLVGLY